MGAWGSGARAAVGAEEFLVVSSPVFSAGRVVAVGAAGFREEVGEDVGVEEVVEEAVEEDVGVSVVDVSVADGVFASSATSADPHADKANAAADSVISAARRKPRRDPYERTTPVVPLRWAKRELVEAGFTGTSFGNGTVGTRADVGRSLNHRPAPRGKPIG